MSIATETQLPGFPETGTVPRQSHRWGQLLAVCALAFVVTAGAVYCVGRRVEGRARPALARATVSLDAGHASDPRAVRENAAAQGDLPAELEIDLQPADAPGRAVVVFALRGGEASDPAAEVNRVARRFAQHAREQGEAAAQEAWLRARDTADEGRRSWMAAEGDRQRFLAAHFEQLQGQAKELDAWSASSAAGPGRAGASHFVPPAPVPVRLAAPSQVRLAENPDWTALALAIEQAESDRRELLDQRTPEHPDVRDLDARLAELRHRLEGLPRQVVRTPAQPGEAADLTAPPDQTVVPAPSPLAEIARRNQEAGQEYAALEARCAEARRAYEKLAAAEMAALAAKARLPQIETDLAAASEEQAAEGERSSVPLVALAAGLAAAFSAGMVRGWGGPTECFATVEQLQAGLPVPVVGNISRRGGDPKPGSTGARSHPLLRTAASLALAAAMTLCIGAAALLALGFRPTW